MRSMARTLYCILFACACHAAQAQTYPTRAIRVLVGAGVPGYEMTLWNAMFAPAATPKEVIARLNSEIRKALQSPDVQERLASLGAVPGGGSLEELGTYFRSEIEKFGKIVRATGMKVE